MKKRTVTAVIKSYHYLSRMRIEALVGEFLAGTELEEKRDLLFTCMDEMIKNAIKANYKHILITEGLKTDIGADGLSVGDRKGSIHMEFPEDYERIAMEKDKNMNIMKKVRAVLDEEARQREMSGGGLKGRENRRDGDKSNISQNNMYNAVMKAVRTGKVVTTLKLIHDEEMLTVRVTNSASILRSDLERIYEKLNEFRKFREEGREHEFFMNNLDTSQAGFGLGYAIIDSCCAGMGLAAETVLSISAVPETIVEMNIPLRSFEDYPCEVEFIEVA